MKKQISKGLSAMIVIAIMVLSMCMSKVGARVEPYTIVFNIDPNATAQHTMVVDGNHLKIDGQYVDPVPVNQDIDFGGFTVSQNGNNIEMVITWGEPVTLNFNSGNAFELFMNGNPLSVETIINSAQNVQVQDYAGQQQGGNEQQGNVGGPDTIEFDVNFTNAQEYMWINDVNVMDEVEGQVPSSYAGRIENAGTVNPEENNIIRFCVPFLTNQVHEFTINGTKYNRNSPGVSVGNNGDEYTITVPGATKYTITGTGVQTENTGHTIIWANVGADETNPEYDEDMLLQHGAARVIAVYDVDGNLLPPESYIGERGNQYGIDESNGMGWVLVNPNCKVIFEFVPEYGYQLTGVKANGFDLEPQETTNQYEYIMPDTNVHFAAEFKKIEDVLDTDSETVTGGTITLGNALDGGTAKLTVNDVKLPADKIKGFEDAAGDYSVKTFLDIDLFQVFYKGKDDDEDVWSNKIDELDKEATITLKLADGLTADDIVIVHNIHDGEEYEVIKIESYDEATNTITFKTKSFSNYAIATKGDGKKSDSPKAGDMVALFVGIVAIASAVMVWAIRNKKKND